MGNTYGEENLTNLYEIVTEEALKEAKKEDSKMANHIERMKAIAEIEKTMAEARLSDAKAFKETEEMRLKESEIHLKEAEVRVAKKNAVVNAISKIGGLGLGAGSFWLLLKQEITGSFHTKGLSWFTEWWRMSK